MLQSQMRAPPSGAAAGDEDSDGGEYIGPGLPFDRSVQSLPPSRSGVDSDPSRLTTFPVPGFFSSTLQLVKDTTLGAADQVASVVKPRDMPPMSASQYWMPDHLCKVCYDCGAAFSLFRRRHHCRLCGQIFCYECSNQFIDGIPHGFSGIIRICKFCAKYVIGEEQKHRGSSGDSRHPSAEDASLTGANAAHDVGAVPLAPVSSPLLFSPVHSGGGAAITSQCDDGSEELDSPALDPDVLLGPPPLFTIHSTESMDFDNADAVGSQRTFNSRPSLSRRRRSSAELLGAIGSSGLLESEQDLSAKPLGGRPQRPSLTRESLSFRIKSDMHTQNEIILDKFMQVAHERIRSGIERSVDRVAKYFAGDGIEVKRLVSSLQDMAFVVTGHLLFSMNFRSPNGFNFSKLVKVKSIATTERAHKDEKDRYNFKWLAGCICHKQLSHKQMARQIANPRILVLAGGISYDRSFDSNKLSSLDTLIEQEKSYMGILVDKISVLEPDVVFVEKTVSRHAQELLRERGVAIVLNVKRDTLERICRHTGATVLTSVDHVDQEDPVEVIGTCRSFYAKTVPVSIDDDSESSNLITPRGKTETHLYLDGCDPLNGCTVLITGPSKKKLRVLKSLMRSVLTLTYRLLLEAHILSQLDIGMGEGCFQSFADGKERVIWCTISTSRHHESSNGKSKYYQCSGSKHIGIATYSEDDVSLGSFLVKEMEALAYKCHNPKCNYMMVDHVQTFSSRIGAMTVSFEELPDQGKESPSNHTGSCETDLNFDSTVLTTLTNISTTNSPSNVEEASECPTIVYWRWCRECACVVTPFIPLQKYVYKYSFARLLEVFFSDHEGEAAPTTTHVKCQHDFMVSHVLFFNVGAFVARFDFGRHIPIRILTSTPGEGEVETNHGEQGIRHAVQWRTLAFTTLMESLVSHFQEKIDQIQQAVEGCGDHDELYTRLLIEAEFVKKLIDGDRNTLTGKLNQADTLPPNAQLWGLNCMKRVLYHMSCKWIEELLKLRKLIKTSVSKDQVGTPATGSSFQLSGLTFSTPNALSPAPSPRVSKTLSPRAFRDATVGTNRPERSRSAHANSDSACINGSTTDRDSIVTSAMQSPGNSLSGTPVALRSSPPTKTEAKEVQSSWKSVLWDIYRVLGRSTPGDDFDLHLPSELVEGHPSLPAQDDNQVILVNGSEPITYVAYALCTESYDEQLGAWKFAVHKELAASEEEPTRRQLPELMTAQEGGWLRAALETPSNMQFKHAAIDIPRHASLSSGSVSSSMWEFTTVACFPLQFEALRELYFGSRTDFIFSIAHVNNWEALGGKSGASFYRTLDDRFVVKHVTATEFQSFSDVLPTYFKYMSKIYYDKEPSVISKTVGMYQTTITRRDTGQKTVHNIVVMENAFFQKSVTQIYDLKGSSRNRFVKQSGEEGKSQVLLDGNFVEFTGGMPLPILAEDHDFLVQAIKNDTSFLSSINIVDFSLVVGFGSSNGENSKISRMTVGIIDYLRQFDFIKRVESVSKSVGMIAGQSSPTIIEPVLYCKRFTEAIKRYFMPVTPISSNRNDHHELRDIPRSGGL